MSRLGRGLVAIALVAAMGGAGEAKPAPHRLAAARDVVSQWIKAQPAPFDVFLDQYNVEKDGTIGVLMVAFVGDKTELHILRVGDDRGAARIVGEETRLLKRSNKKEIPIGFGSVEVGDIFPKGFASLVQLEGGECDEKHRCDPSLRLDDLLVPLGIATNTADGEGSTGAYEGHLQVVPIAAKGALDGAVLVVLENRDPKQVVIGRHATLVTKAHVAVWAGDLLAGKGKRARYQLKDGVTIDQYVPGSGTVAPVACRLSIVAPTGQPVGLVYGCGVDRGVAAKLR